VLCSDEEFEAGRQQAQQEGVTIRDKEHLHYYREFRWVGGTPGGRYTGWAVHRGVQVKPNV